LFKTFPFEIICADSLCMIVYQWMVFRKVKSELNDLILIPNQHWISYQKLPKIEV
jgi:hypothetical protein